MSDEILTDEETGQNGPAPKKSRAGKIVSCLSWVILLLAAGCLAYVMICASSGRMASFFGKSIIRVVTGSMEPSIYTGEYIFIDRISPDDVGIDDMIAFYSDDPEIKDELVIHRVVAINDDGTFMVKGDANPIADKYPVRRERLAGRYIGRARLFNWLSSFADARKLLLILVVIPIFFVSIFELRTVTKLMKEVEKERKKDKDERAAEQQKELEEKIEELKKAAVEEYIREHEEDKKEDEDSQETKEYGKDKEEK